MNTGLDPIIEYEVYWDNGSAGSTWLFIRRETSPAFTFAYIHGSGVSRGQPYQFKYRAVNQMEEGPFSDAATIYASRKPDPPPSISTAVSNTDVIVSWQQSVDDHGATVTDYEIEFRHADETSYSPISAHCNPIGGSNEFLNRQCTIPMSVFREAPFLLSVNTRIVGVVRATNVKGTSGNSNLNTSGVLVQNVPQGKLTLARGAATSAL